MRTYFRLFPSTGIPESDGLSLEFRMRCTRAASVRSRFAWRGPHQDPGYLVDHDVIVVGGSAGCVEVLLEAFTKLPGDLPASVLVALHSAPGYESQLPELMSARGRLPATYPLHGDKPEQGHIYVAPPDNHLYLRAGHMEIVRGPKENGHRPSVDALFRTASAAYGARVIGVVLSGYGDCGTAGMMSIKARGGLAVVQEPASALVSQMPCSVLDRVHVDHVTPPPELANLLARLAHAPAPPHSGQPDHFVQQVEGTEQGIGAKVVCPTCQGVLTQTEPGSFEHFRCHVGHTFSMNALLSEQNESLERALWAAVRALEESAGLSRRLVLKSAGDLRRRFAEKAKTQAAEADLIRNMLLRGRGVLPQLSSEEPSVMVQGSLVE